MKQIHQDDHYHAILKAIPDLMLLVEADGTCVEVITPQAEIVGTFLPIHNHIREILPPPLLAQQLEAIASVLTTGKVMVYEHQLEKFGNQSYEEIRISPVSDQKVLILVRDITNNKLAQQKLTHTNLELNTAYHKLSKEIDERKQIETELEQIFNLSLDLIGIAGMDGYFHKINPAFSQILGHTPEQLLNTPFINFVHPEDRPATIKELEKLANGELCIKFRNRYLCQDGSYRWLSWNATPMIPEGLIYAVGRDITEQQQIEKSLKESETNNRAILNALPDCMFRFSQEGIFLDYNTAHESHLVIPPSQFLGKNVAQVLPLNIAQAIQEAIAQVLATNEITCLEYHLPIGEEIRYYEARLTTFGETEVLAIVRNVTEQKQAQQQLYQTEERLQYLLSASPAVLYSAQFEPWKTTFISNNVTFVLGYAPSVFLEQPNFLLEQIHPEDLSFILKILPDLVAQRYYSFKYRFLHGDGTYRWILDEGQLVEDEEGYPLEFVGSLIDITELQQSQSALLMSEERLKLALDAVEEGVWDWDLNTGKIYRSAQWALMLGYEPDEIDHNIQTRDKLTHPEDLPAMKKELETHLAGEKPSFHYEFRMRRKSGEWCWIQDRGKVVARDEQGKPLRMVGTQKDITERKQADLELAQKNLDLEIAQAQLAESNRTLEQKVEQRTQELSETLEILKATQTKLLLENALLRDAKQRSAFDYQVGGSLPLDAPTYVVRSADRYFYKAIQQGEFCYVLNTRQMGKSSLLVQMLHQLEQEGFYCAAIDLTMLGSDTVTLEQWYKGLAIQLAQKFKLLNDINFKQWWQEKSDLSPVQRLSYFIEEVILVKTGLAEGKPESKLVIFFDEIDSVLGLNFPVNDFFAWIRSCYNQRSLNHAYNRLTFALFGVATPADLMDDLYRTPFNIGQAIHLKGFQLYEAQSLLQGLTGKVSNPQKVLQEVLAWTAGQPFLTQKLLQIIKNSDLSIPDGKEAKYISNLVQKRIIEDWETQDEPTHFKTIRDRILRGKIPAERLLSLYQQILIQNEVNALGTIEEKELILSGLVVKQKELLRVNNLIYSKIFNQNWIKRISENLTEKRRN